jgi:hypothetical protein
LDNETTTKVNFKPTRDYNLVKTITIDVFDATHHHTASSDHDSLRGGHAGDTCN